MSTTLRFTDCKVHRAKVLGKMGGARILGREGSASTEGWATPILGL